MRILVTYESRGGRTRRAAEAIAQAVRTQGHTVAVVLREHEHAKQHGAGCGTEGVETIAESALEVGEVGHFGTWPQRQSFGT